MKEDDKVMEIKIPDKKLRAKGVIRDWDGDMPLEELIEAIDDKRSIVCIERMRHRYYDKEEKKTKWKLGSNVVVTVEGNLIPRELKLWGNITSIKIRPYVENVKQCYNCYKYGHIKLHCKNAKKCATCGGKYHEACGNKMECLNCGEEHRAFYRGCEVYRYNRDLKIIMAEEGCNILEAKKKWESVHQVRKSKWNDNINWSRRFSEEGKYGKNMPTRRETEGNDYDSNCEDQVGLGEGRKGRKVRGTKEICEITGENRKREGRVQEKEVWVTSQIQEIKEMINILMKKLDDLKESREKNEIMEGMAKWVQEREYVEDMGENRGQEISMVVAHELIPMEEKLIDWNEEVQMCILEEVEEEGDLIIENVNGTGITETKIKEGERFRMRGYETCHSEGSGRRVAAGGAAVLVKRNIKFDRIQVKGITSRGLDVAGIRTKFNKKETIIMIVYRKPGRIEPSNTWRKLVQDNREAMEDQNMYLLNDDTKSRIGEGGTRDSNLDLLFVSSGIMEEARYKQLEDSWGSDHFPLEMVVERCKDVYKKKSNRISTKKTNWDEYTDIMKEKGKELLNKGEREDNIEKRYGRIKEWMIEGIKKASNKVKADTGREGADVIKEEREGGRGRRKGKENKQNREW